MPEHNQILTFLDRFLDVPEAKVTYLTRPTPIDRLIARIFLPFLPASITPTDITKFRLITIPFIALLFALDYYLVGTILFLFSALSDAIDGALARTERKITSWGTLYDPIADKLLIGTVAIIVISKYISAPLAFSIVLLELLLVASAYYRYKGRVVPAKWMGKIKMILQCVGILFLLLFIIFEAPLFLSIGIYTLYVAIVFALLSLLVFRSI
jgi:CDP-diacylglycerol--glycerol-3-phosphate 3-phosphatidyltransferase